MNKKIITLIVGILTIIGIAVAVFIILKNKNMSDANTNNFNNTTENLDKGKIPDSTNSPTRIKLTFEDKVLYVKLIDNESSRDLISMLPLEVSFDDYNNTEKIASLPRKLELKNSPKEYSVQVGDFAYYAPWGNLSIFYKEFESSNSLQKLGEFETGIDELKNLKEKAVIEIVDE